MSYKQTDRDLIIELAYTVAKLERKVERLEESLEKTDGKAEMLIDDVVMLDERLIIGEEFMKGVINLGKTRV